MNFTVFHSGRHMFLSSTVEIICDY